MTIADYVFTAYEVLHKVGEDPGVQAALASAKAGKVDYLEIAIAIAKAGYAAAGNPTPAQIIAAIESLIHPAPVTP
jgi:hypothetical protein